MNELENDARKVMLKYAPIAGLYCCVAPEAADELEGLVLEEGCHCRRNPSGHDHLARPPKDLLVLGDLHPAMIRDVFVDSGWDARLGPEVPLPEESYAPPLTLLLTADVPSGPFSAGHFAALGIDRSHVPELIRMATDKGLHTAPQKGPLCWAPVQAWWALGELRAEKAIPVLLGLLQRIDDEDDDTADEDIPRVLAAIGPAALAPAVVYLAEPDRGEWARIAAARVLQLIGERYPDRRTECVDRLQNQLLKFEIQSALFNAFLVSYLVDLDAVEAAGTMELAFAAGAVDESLMGDWEDVQIQLGLKTKRNTTRRPNSLSRIADGWHLDSDLDDDEQALPVQQPAKIGRNDPCPCGSGKKYKKCCGP